MDTELIIIEDVNPLKPSTTHLNASNSNSHEISQ